MSLSKISEFFSQNRRIILFSFLFVAVFFWLGDATFAVDPGEY